VTCCYEAGSVGFEPQRELLKHGLDCQVIAPSLIPFRPGERLKTDRRDARKLAGLFRAGELVEVLPPTPEEEALRDLCRARGDARDDLLRSRHRLSKFLLRHGLRFTAGKKSWTKIHMTWLRSQKFEIAEMQMVFDDYLRTVELSQQRVADLTKLMEQQSKQEPWAQAVSSLRAFRGIDTVTALSLVAELYNFARFDSPRKLMAYLGLVPSEHSSGGQRRQGGITKTGNGHVRRLLVESSWHYRNKPHSSYYLRSRQKDAPAWVVTIAERAQHRLHQRYWRLVNRGKPTPKAVTAVAREMVGFIWSVLYPLATTPAQIQK